ncbi:hypothetical protein F4808DRAFT_267599 [Astrocystis sublimbata]|nr:hypothetical protein F4808DRAFT_267599 [Astrocystis sublimbata]
MMGSHLLWLSPTPQAHLSLWLLLFFGLGLPHKFETLGIVDSYEADYKPSTLNHNSFPLLFLGFYHRTRTPNPQLLFPPFFLWFYWSIVVFVSSFRRVVVPSCFHVFVFLWLRVFISSCCRAFFSSCLRVFASLIDVKSLCRYLIISLYYHVIIFEIIAIYPN